MIGPWQLVLVIVVILLLFGGKRIPEIAASLGKGIREFKKAMDAPEKDKEKEDDKGKKDGNPAA